MTVEINVKCDHCGKIMDLSCNYSKTQLDTQHYIDTKPIVEYSIKKDLCLDCGLEFEMLIREFFEKKPSKNKSLEEIIISRMENLEGTKKMFEDYCWNTANIYQGKIELLSGILKEWKKTNENTK